MRIGILQCDDVMGELQPEFGNYPAMFERRLGDAGNGIEFRTFRATDGELPKTVRDCDGGSRPEAGTASMTTRRGYTSFANSWLTSPTAKCVALASVSATSCLRRASAAASRRQPMAGPSACRSTRVGERRPWMDPPFNPGLDLIVCNQEQVTKLPGGAETLAGSRLCPNFLVQFSDNLVGIQGHPEFSKAFSAALMDGAQRHYPPPSESAMARASLSAAVDDRLCMRWIANFLDGR